MIDINAKSYAEGWIHRIKVIKNDKKCMIYKTN